MASASPFSFASAPFSVEENSPFGPPSSHRDVGRAPVSKKLDASEVESNAAAIEIVVRWGDDILHIEHLESARSYSVGDGADFVMPSEKLQLVDVRGASAFAMIPEGAKTSETAREIPLVEGVRVKFEHKGFSFEIASVKAGKKVAGKGRGDKRAFGAQAVSIGIHGAILATMFAFMPALAATEEGDIDDSQSYMLQLLQSAEADREREIVSDPKMSDASEAGSEGGAPKAGTTSTQSLATGKNVTQTNKRLAVSTDEKERSLAKMQMKEEAASFGMIGLLASADSTNKASSPWGSEAHGPDASDANGSLWADEIGDSWGPGGLNLSTDGERPGGPSNIVWMSHIQTAGNRDGNCFGPRCGNGPNSGGYIPGTHTSKPPSIKPETIKKTGRMPAEVIQRVVRQNFGRFRACYEMGLRSNPNLAGRVAVAFTVGRDGAVGMVQSAGSDLPDAGVVGCVTKAFYGLSFPAPEGGTVNVTYPIVFAPSK